VLQEHLAVLLVVVPLLSAPVCALFPFSKSGGKLAWLISTLVSLFTFIAALFIVDQVSRYGVISYHLGGWEPPWGIEYRIDHLGSYVILIVSAMASITMLAARKSIEKEIDEKKISLFYSAFLLCLTGLLGIVATGDAFNIFVFLEISSLSSYALIAMGHNRKALTASYQYLIMGTIGATFILIGIGLLYKCLCICTFNDHCISFCNCNQGFPLRIV